MPLLIVALTNGGKRMRVLSVQSEQRIDALNCPEMQDECIEIFQNEKEQLFMAINQSINEKLCVYMHTKDDSWELTGQCEGFLYMKKSREDNNVLHFVDEEHKQLIFVTQETPPAGINDVGIRHIVIFDFEGSYRNDIKLEYAFREIQKIRRFSNGDFLIHMRDIYFTDKVIQYLLRVNLSGEIVWEYEWEDILIWREDEYDRGRWTYEIYDNVQRVLLLNDNTIALVIPVRDRSTKYKMLNGEGREIKNEFLQSLSKPHIETDAFEFSWPVWNKSEEGWIILEYLKESHSFFSSSCLFSRWKLDKDLSLIEKSETKKNYNTIMVEFIIKDKYLLVCHPESDKLIIEPILFDNQDTQNQIVLKGIHRIRNILEKEDFYIFHVNLKKDWNYAILGVSKDNKIHWKLKYECHYKHCIYVKDNKLFLYTRNCISQMRVYNLDE